MLRIDLVQFDSYGAKSSCIKVITRDVKIIIDPGVAIMHPSFPASLDDKIQWLEEGRHRIYNSLDDADIIIITHYHYDHYFPDDPNIYGGRLAIFTKNPNIYINDSQRHRAIEFLTMLSESFGVELGKVNQPELYNVYDLVDELRSTTIDFGEYNDRRKELLAKGKAWFLKRMSKWLKWDYMDEMYAHGINLIYPENSVYRFGDTVIRFTPPLFHGIEYSRVGWVYAVNIEYDDEKVFYSSDINGPIIEDYADMIIDEDPDYIILDGPMTYMFGYTLNRINLNRVLTNVIRIIEEVDFELLIWDHHLPREKKFRERTLSVWNRALELDKNMYTAREYRYGRPPIVEEL